MAFFFFFFPLPLLFKAKRNKTGVEQEQSRALLRHPNHNFANPFSRISAVGLLIPKDQRHVRANYVFTSNSIRALFTLVE